MKKVIAILLLTVFLFTAAGCSRPDYTGIWLAFMVETPNGRQYSMLEYFSDYEEEFTVIIRINADGTYLCSTFIGENLIETEKGTYTLKGDKIDFNEAKTYSGSMVKGYLAVKYEAMTLYFGKTDG